MVRAEAEIMLGAGLVLLRGRYPELGQLTSQSDISGLSEAG